MGMMIMRPTSEDYCEGSICKALRTLPGTHPVFNKH